jgi:hypothetical protein
MDKASHQKDCATEKVTRSELKGSPRRMEWRTGPHRIRRANRMFHRIKVTSSPISHLTFVQLTGEAAPLLQQHGQE